jgi:hypothetical protein
MVLKTTLISDVVDSGNEADLTVTIPAGQTTSSELWVGGGTYLGVRMPSAWTSASITFEESKNNDIYRQLTDGDGDPITISTPAANKTHKWDIGLFYGIQWLRVVSSAPQASDRKIELIMAGV